jgi:hypothetical protein
VELLELKAPVPRGRPRKRTEIEENDNGELDPVPGDRPRKRGRPRKVQ